MAKSNPTVYGYNELFIFASCQQYINAHMHIYDDDDDDRHRRIRALEDEANELGKRERIIIPKTER